MPLDIGVGGPMARYASDLTLGLDIVACPSGLDAAGWKLELPQSPKKRLDEFRVAVMLESPCVVQDSELTNQLARTVDALADFGVEIGFEAPARHQHRTKP